jgi:AraC-like DNA-binding protein
VPVSKTTTPYTYREAPPPAALSELVECFWRREPWEPPHLTLGVMPDGRVDILWAEHGEAVVIGPQTRALGRPVPAEYGVVGVRLRPGIGSSLLGVPAHEIADMHIGLDAIDSRAADVLVRALRSIGDAARAPSAMARAIATVSETRGAPDHAIRAAARLLAIPRARVERVARAVGVSERELERRFREFVGYGPKTLHRVLRFQRVLEALGGARRQDGLARIAAFAGYSDQAHLTREVRELSGLTPARLERELAVLAMEGASGIFKTGSAPMPTLLQSHDGDGRVRNPF